MQDGYHDLPRGKIACVVTYLEMLSRPQARPTPVRSDLALKRLRGDDCELYRTIFRTIGERWLWFSRLAMKPADLAALLDDPGIEAHALMVNGRPAGLLDLDLRDPANGELAFFGLFEHAIGAGAGRWLMNEALRIAWDRPVSRLFVHTCTFDHPSAVAFYKRSGFTPYKLAVEIADDPRLRGLMPRDALPDIPLIG